MGEVYTYTYTYAVGRSEQTQQPAVVSSPKVETETKAPEKKRKPARKQLSIEEIVETKNMCISALFKHLIRNKKDTVGPAVLHRQKRVLELVNEFNSLYFNRVIVFPVEIKQAYCFSFKEWLLHDKKFEASYARKVTQIYTQAMDLAVSHELTQYNHFAKIKFKVMQKPIKFLSVDEVNSLSAKTHPTKSIERIKNLFLMQCYTGLAFTDLFTLKAKHIIKQKEAYWISKERCKTGVLARIPLCNDAIRIINEFAACSFDINNTKDNESFLFRSCTNQKYNKALKDITEHFGFDTPLTSHMGRKTFAMSALNSGKTSIETVSAMLGHANTQVTQKVYAKIGDNRILAEMSGVNIYGK